MPQCIDQCLMIGVCINTDFALIDHRLAVRDQIFDRIFDGDDVPMVELITVFEHAGQRCGFTGSAGTDE